MASQINTANIDTAYPEAGKDNSTQGFRDNFSEIVTNLGTAKKELEDLQNNVARTDEGTDFNTNSIIDANLEKTTESVFDIGNVTQDQTVDFTNGHYHKAEIGANVNFVLSGWPDTGRRAKITLELSTDGTSRTATFSVEGSGVIKRNAGVPVELYDSTDGSTFNLKGFPENLEIPNSSDPVVVEFWTTDGGNTVFANYVGQFV